MRGGAAVIGLATVAVGAYDATIELEGLAYAYSDELTPEDDKAGYVSGNRSQ